MTLRRLLLLSLLGATALPAPAEEPPSAFDLLDQVREAYAALDGYRDQGTLLREEVRPGDLAEVRTGTFSTVVDSTGGFVFQVTWEGEEPLTYYREPEGARLHEGATGRVLALPSLAGELLLSLGEGSQDALVVPALLLKQPTALGEPTAASVEGPEPCGPGEERREERQCWILSLTQPGDLSGRLWVDAETFLLRKVMVEPGGGADLFTPGGPAPSEVRLLVEHVPQIDGSAIAVFEPPPAPPESIAEKGEGRGRDGALDEGFGETVEVKLRTFQVRILDDDGSPVRGIRPEDLRVRLGRREVPVNAVDWVQAGQPPGADLPPEVLAESGLAVAPPGQLLVFFVQADHEPSRVKGHLKQVRRAEELLTTLGPEDRVAVVSFDSHLRLRQDFTRNHRAVNEALADSIRFANPTPPPKPGPYPSLARHFDVAEAKDVAFVEEALEFTAKALEPLLGEKTMVFVGWGVGDYTDGGVRYGLDYDRALEALARSRTSVFVLDVSQADYHTLELGLKQIAADTGGTYERIFRRDDLATRRLARTLSGYYLVTVDATETRPRDLGNVRIDLKNGRAQVIVTPRSGAGL